MLRHVFYLKKKIMCFILIMLLLTTANVFAAGDWVTMRNGADNTGVQLLGGNMTSPSSNPLWSTHVTGDLASSLIEYDVNGDGYRDMIFVEGGCVKAIDRNNNQIWKTSPINAYDIYGVYDLDNNGSKEIVAFATRRLLVLSLSDGSTLWSLQLSQDLEGGSRFKIEDLDGDSKMEVVFYLYGQPFIYCYTFKNGVTYGSSMWTITDTRTEGEGNISAYAPEIAISDIDGDGIKEVAVARYAGMDFYDGRTGLISIPPSTTNWAASANGATIAVDSEYYSGGYPKANAIDGNANTYWINNRVVPGWAEITFNGYKYIKYVNFMGVGCEASFNVQTWDGSQWVSQGSVSGNSRGQVLITFNSKVRTNKIKVNITGSVAHDGSGIFQCQLASIEAYEEMPCINWAQSVNGAVVTADSEYNSGGYPKTQINDGNTNTYWINNRVVPGWIQVDFIAPQSIQYVKLSGMGSSRDFQVQTWDGASWVTQISITGNTALTRLIKFNSAVNTQKVRIYITNSVANDGRQPIVYQCQFSELEAYEKYTPGYNFASGAAVTADSDYYSGGYPRTNINDGNINTYWINNKVVPGWIQVDYTDPEDIQYVDLYGMACSQGFNVQTWDGSQWITQKTVSGNYVANAMVKFSSPVSTNRIRVNITSSSANDGQLPITNQSQFSELEARQDPKDFTTAQRKADWIPGNANGRNYGLLKLIDIDQDGIKEGIIVADGVCRHVGVVDNAAHGTQLLYDRYIEYPIINKTMRVVPDDVCDIDGDGNVEIVYCVYDSTTAAWTLYIVDARTNVDKQTITGLYLWGIEDVNNDGRKELLVSEETTASPANTSTIRVYGVVNGSYQSIWSKANSAFVIEKSTFTTNDIGDGSYGQRTRPLMTDMDNNGVAEFFINDSGTYKAIDCTTGNTKWSTTQGVPKKVVSLFNNNDSQIVTVDTDGKMKLIDKNQNVLWTRDAGCVPNITPVTADIDNDGKMEMVVADGSKTRVYRIDGTGATLLWTHQGKGTLFYANGNTSAVIADVYGDSRKEIIIRDVNASGEPMIKVLDCNGNTCWSYTFSGFGSNAIYQWLVGDFNGDGVKDIYVALLANGIDTGRSRIINGANQTLLWSSADTYNVAAGVTRSAGPYPGIPAVKDIDGDFRDELIFVSLDTYFKFDWNGSTMAESHVLSTGTTDIYYNSMIPTDIDSNGSIENIFAAGFNRFSIYNNSMTQLWSMSAGGNYDIMRRMQGIADVDNDGIKETAIQFQLGSLTNRIYCYNAANGTNEWNYDLSASFGNDVVATDIQAADIDGDGRKEFIFGTNTGYLVALNGEAGASSRVCWSINTGVSLGNVVVTDVDGDNSSEVLVFAGDGKLYAFN